MTWTHLQQEDQLLELQEELRLEVTKNPSPTGLRVYGSVRAVLAGAVPEEILVDEWPKWNVAIVRPTSRSQEERSKHLLRTVSIHCRSSESLHPGIVIEEAIDWTQPYTFACLPLQTATIVTSLGGRHGSLVRLIDCETLVHQNEAVLERPIPVPDKYLLTTVMPSMARTVVSHWRQNAEQTTGNDDEAIQLVEYNSLNFPSSCIVDSSGKPVAHVLCHYYGAVGMLGLARDHKGHGLAALVLHDLCRKLKAQTQPIWAHVEKGNMAAAELFIRTGFSPLRSAATVWLEYTPTNTSPTVESQTEQAEMKRSSDEIPSLETNFDYF